MKLKKLLAATSVVATMSFAFNVGTAAADPPVITDTFDWIGGNDYDRFGEWEWGVGSSPKFVHGSIDDSADPEACPDDECGLYVLAPPDEYGIGDDAGYGIVAPGGSSSYIASADIGAWRYHRPSPAETTEPQGAYLLAAGESPGWVDSFLPVNSGNGTKSLEGDSDTRAFIFGFTSEDDGEITEPRYAYLGNITLEYGDGEAPTLSSFGEAVDGTWVAGEPFEAGVEAADDGLGLSSIEVVGDKEFPAGPNDKYRTSWSGDCSGLTDSPCPVETPVDTVVEIDAGELAEGANTLTAKAEDALGKESTGREIDIRVDKSLPTVDITGSFTSAPGMVLTAASYTLYVDTYDGDELHPGSGIVKAEILVDDVVIDSDDQPCVTENCDMDLGTSIDPDEYGNGPHQLKVKATDAVGHVKTTTVDFEVDR